jgi:hypothetical protein
VHCRPDAPASGVGAICVRARDLALAADGFPGRIARLAYQGGRFTAEAALDAPGAPSLRIELPEPAPVAAGDRIGIAIRDGWLLPG